MGRARPEVWLKLPDENSGHSETSSVTDSVPSFSCQRKTRKRSGSFSRTELSKKGEQTLITSRAKLLPKSPRESQLSLRESQQSPRASPPPPRALLLPPREQLPPPPRE